MSIEPEVIDIKTVSDTPTITLSKNDRPTAPRPAVPNQQPSVNFGGGLELLMNDKLKSSGSKTNTKDIGLDDLK